MPALKNDITSGPVFQHTPTQSAMVMDLQGVHTN